MEERVLQRVKEIVNAKSNSVNDFSKRIGMVQNTVNNQVNGVRGISFCLVDSVLAAFPDISAEWLLRGTGGMLIDDEGNEGSILVEPEAAAPKAATIPLIPYLAKGGALSGVGEEGVCRSDCEQVISPLRGADAAITVSGDSMAPKYPSGSRLFIQRVNGSAYIDWGAIYVLDTCNGIIVKKVTASKDTDCVTCVSLNPDPSYAPFDIRKEDVYGMFRVLGCLIFE